MTSLALFAAVWVAAWAVVWLGAVVPRVATMTGDARVDRLAAAMVRIDNAHRRLTWRTRAPFVATAVALAASALAGTLA